MMTTEMIFEALIHWPYNHPTRLLPQKNLLKAYELYTEDRRGTCRKPHKGEPRDLYTSAKLAR
jgi:hypothetical protein